MLARILAGIRHGRTLPASTFGTDVEDILRMRERQLFEKELVKRFDAVDALKSGVPKAELEYVEDFVEEVFVHVFEQTQSDDLSAYVSDDFGLLAEALHLGYEDEWLNGLATIYSDGRIPCETVEPKPGMLRDHLSRLSGS